MNIRPPYLFDPETVEERVAPLPLTAKLIHEKKRVGDPSNAFPKLQTTQREILRILGRAHVYDHLDELLQSLERCLAAGWDAHQLGARDRDEFASLMSDLQVAEHCLIRGFTIDSPVGLNVEGPKPDLYIRKGGLAAAVEVFRPRELPSFHNFLTDATRLLNEADIRLDVVSDFDDTGKLVSPWHPLDLEEALSPVATEALERIAAKVDALEPGACQVLTEEWPDRNLKVSVELHDVEPSTDDEPARLVSSSKGFGGYEPVGMLARLMPAIVSKAKKRQAGDRGDRARVLVCDISEAVAAAHLSDDHRKEGYVEVLLRELEPQVEDNYDVIALCERTGWGTPLHLHFCVCAGAEYHGLVHELFGGFTTVASG